MRVEFICARCGVTFYKEMYYVRDHVKRNKPIKYCSRACSYTSGKVDLIKQVAAHYPTASRAKIGRGVGVTRERVRQVLGNKFKKRD